MAIGFIRPLAGTAKKAFSLDFGFTGGIQNFVAPYDGYYRLVGYGGAGGKGGNSYRGGAGGSGGLGGFFEVVAYLSKNTTIDVYVGGKGGAGYWGDSTDTSPALTNAGPGGYIDGAGGGLPYGYNSQHKWAGSGAGGGGSTYFYDRIRNVKLCSADGGGGGSGSPESFDGNSTSGAGGKGGGTNGGGGGPSQSINGNHEGWKFIPGVAGGSGGYVLATEFLALYSGQNGKNATGGQAKVEYIGKTLYG